jgi:hypothetical protein
VIAGRVPCDARRGQHRPARNCTGGEPKSLCHAQGQPKCLRGRDGLGQPSSVADGQLEWLGNAIGSPILAAKRRCLEQALAGPLAWSGAALGKGCNYFFGSERVAANACTIMTHHSILRTRHSGAAFLSSNIVPHVFHSTHQSCTIHDTNQNNKQKHSPLTRTHPTISTCR